MKNLSILFSYLVCFYVVPITFGQSEQILFDEKEAKLGWQKMALLIENCSGEVLTYYEGLPDTKERTIAFKGEFQKNFGGRYYKETHWRKSNEMPNGDLSLYKVFCTNENNFFSLRAIETEKEKTENAWRILGIQPNNMPLEENPVLVTQSDSGALRFLRASYTILGIPLWKLWEDTNFSLKSIESDTTDSSLVKINFHWVIPNYMAPPEHISPNVEVTLTLNPNSCWRIEKSLTIISETTNGKIVKSFPSSYPEYQLSENGVPYVVKVSSYGSREHYVEKKMPVYVGEVTYYNFRPSPKEDFRLSYYGFPEPDFDHSRRTNYVRYILMGLGIIMIGIALWRIIQKRRKRK